ncbi:MAG TPA: DUF6468 domain-containing protein [Alphaproteobacteria bacterium]|nr:DUF6468 domain-containing protein [Alphaproteobacteria bacterium]
MGFAVFLDGLIVILLSVTITYAVILNRKLRNLHAGESEMLSAIGRFNIATSQAESNLARYKDIAAQPTASRDSVAAGRALAPLVAEARKLATDLNLLIARGETEIVQRTAVPQPRILSSSQPRTQPKQVALGQVRTSGRVDMANPAATWPLDEELELIDALKDAR